MSDLPAHNMLDEILSSLNSMDEIAVPVIFKGADRLPSCFPVSDLSVAAIGAAGAMIATLAAHGRTAPAVTVDYRLAALWFGFSIRPQGWEMPSPWDEIAGDYRTRNGWIKLHTNTSHHRSAALSVLNCEASRDAVEAAVANLDADVLENLVTSAGGCAAKLRSTQEWRAHPQSMAVAKEPLIICEQILIDTESSWRPEPERPLTGIRVLDLTRVLAGPVATRFLAGFGADVLRIDPPDWSEPGVVPEVTLGKRCARLDLCDLKDRETFIQLLAGADILVHGYRRDALEKLGLGVELRRSVQPRLIDVSLNAYGHSGPWANRRGFDSLVQFSTGISAEGQKWKNAEIPVSLPVQALDHATGYLVAATAIRGLIARLTGQGAIRARLSLARTAKLLNDYQSAPTEDLFEGAKTTDFEETIEQTPWGAAHRLRSPFLANTPVMRWDRPATKLGSSFPHWINS